MTNSLPIGVFDSGVGGLTVLRALRDRLPHESLLYLGDTARLPYGTKSPDTIVRYARQATAQLKAEGIKLLVVACNTASAHALPALTADEAPTPVLGVIEPGAAAAVKASRTGRIAILATEGTIRAQAYTQAIHALNPQANVAGLACSLLVALAEEGWTEGAEAEAVVARYLRPLLAEHQPDCLVLGCTHFPLLAPVIRKVAGERITLVDSAQTTAEVVAEVLHQRTIAATGTGQIRLMATDGTQRFAHVASRFLGSPVEASNVRLVNL